MQHALPHTIQSKSGEKLIFHRIENEPDGVHAAMNNSRSAQPEIFDRAYLLRRYRRKYDMLEIPAFVKKVVFPAAYGLGLVLGKYRKFRGAPQPR